MITLSTNALVLIVCTSFLAGWVLGGIVLHWLAKHAEQDRLSAESEAQTERFREHCRRKRE